MISGQISKEQNFPSIFMNWMEKSKVGEPRIPRIEHVIDRHFQEHNGAWLRPVGRLGIRSRDRFMRGTPFIYISAEGIYCEGE